MQSCEKIPWQLLWKNPVLHQARPCTTAESSSSIAPHHEIPPESVVAATAAHLTAAEYSCCLNVLKGAQPNNDGASITTTEGGETSSVEDTSSRGLVHVQLGHGRDALVLQLIDATANTILLEKYLQWPTSASIKTGSSSGILHNVVFCRAISPSNKKNVATRRMIKRQSSLDISDALDVLHLMSLGMHPTDQTNYTTNSSIESRNYTNGMDPRECVEITTDMDSLTMISKNTRVSDFSTSLTSDDEELLLLCVIQNDGVVHWYDAINLLLHESKLQKRKNDGENFASFFLGETLYSIIHERVLPLSSTYATIHLSLMNGSRHMEESNRKDQNQRRIRSPLLHLDLVDASIEPTSSSRRTYTNEITCCVATKEYLVIGGCGKRRTKAIRKVKGGATKGTSEVSNAGWVTFISLRPELNFAQIKSIYLPFALKSLHYVSWEKMDLLIAMSASQHRSKHRLLAIRMDAGLSPIPCNIPSPRFSQYSSLADMLGQTQPSQQPPSEDFSGVTIRRFECLQIRMDNLHLQSLASSNPLDTHKVSKEDIPMVELSVSDQSPTPGIIALYKCPKESAEKFAFVELQSFQPLELGVDKHIVLPVKRLHGHVAMIEYPHNMTPTDSPSSSEHVSMVGCVSGRGWTLLCLQDDAGPVANNSDTYFICWEGQKHEGFSFSQRMNFVHNYHGTLLPNPNMRLVVNILPERMTRVKQAKKTKARSDSYASDGIPSIPTDHSYLSTQTSYSLSLISRKKNKDDIPDENDELCSAVSILTLSERDAPEKRGNELLASVDSWKILDGPSSQEWGVQVAKDILQCTKNGVIILSHRLASTHPLHSYQPDCETLYETILAWLCRDKRDFFMAAYICLLLLGDMDCVKHLQKLGPKTNFNFDDLSFLETRTHQHILDGFEAAPCFGHNGFVNNVEDKVLLNRPSNRISHISDLALVCLVKGGKRMFPALSTFLKSNSHFNTNRAFKVLLGIFLKQLQVYHYRKTVEFPFSEIMDDLLWPVESMLCIAVSRNHMEEALLLLEAAVPTELRGSKDEDLCASLVKIIVQSSVYAPAILLSLTLTTADGEPQRYWSTVPHYLKLKLSLLYFDEHFPMLLIGEIRSWILDEMYQAIESCANKADDLDRVPTNWLCSLCVACLSNSKCDWEKLTTLNSLQASKLYSSSELSDPFEDHLNLYCFKNDTLDGAFTSPFNLNKLDLDLAIPALLTLEYRGQKWDKDCIVSTQMLLNHICKAAPGRPMMSSFAFQAKAVMKQCGKIGNVEAAANLIGGKYGFILRCCHILRLKYPEIKMEEAEYIILCGNGTLHNVPLSSGTTHLFDLLHYHRKVLQMLYDHVLSMTKFGDFDPSSTTKRGVISPVFASRLCLRIWLILTAGSARRERGTPPSPNKATEFLEEWLRYRLRMDEEGSMNVLACAALCRAVLWPAESDSDNECLSGPAASAVLAEELGFSNHFLLSLTKSCRGLIETLPSSVVEKSFIGCISVK